MFETESPSTDAFQRHSISFFVVSSMFAPTLYHYIQKPRKRSRNALPFKEPTSRKDETAVGRLQGEHREPTKMGQQPGKSRGMKFQAVPGTG